MAEKLGAEIGSHGFEYGVKHFKNPVAGFISDIVCEVLQIEKTEVSKLISLGAIYVDNYRQVKDERVKEDKLFRVHTRPRRHNVTYDWLQRIIFEDENYLILNKPAGIPSHAAVDNVIDNSLYQVERARNLKLFITHRLDTLTEGLIVYGKTQRFVNAFNQQIQNRLVHKKYVALVEAMQLLPPKLIHYMETSLRAPKKVTEFFQEKAALCELEILQQIIEGEQSWIKINLLTGRTHQIRAQTSAMGAPVVGDVLYGAKKPWKENAIALRACEIEFIWNERVCLYKLPEEFN